MASATATTPATLVRVFLGLITLLVLTALSTWLPAGPWSLPLALAIATAKLLLIFTYFMQLRHHRGLLRIAAAAGFFWLALILTLTFADYFTRDSIF